MITVLVPTYTQVYGKGLTVHKIVSIVAFQLKAVSKRANGVSDRVMLLKKRSKVIAGTCDPPRSAVGEPINRTVHVGPAIRQVNAVNSLHEVAIMHLGYLAHALDSTLCTGSQLGTARYRLIPVCSVLCAFRSLCPMLLEKMPSDDLGLDQLRCRDPRTSAQGQDVGVPAMVAAERHHRRELAFSSTH
jgi:hypothetical protein